MQAQTALQDAFCNKLLEEGFPPHQIHRVHARISELSTPDIGRISQPHPLQVGSIVEPPCQYVITCKSRQWKHFMASMQLFTLSL